MALVAREKYGQILSLWQALARIERVLPGGLKTVAVMGDLPGRPGGARECCEACER